MRIHHKKPFYVLSDGVKRPEDLLAEPFAQFHKQGGRKQRTGLERGQPQKELHVRILGNAQQCFLTRQSQLMFDDKGAYDIPLLKNNVIVADRFYNDFSLLNVPGSSGIWFVVRQKENLQYETIGRTNCPTGATSMCSKMSWSG